MTVLRKPPRSSACTPTIVLPAGEQTLSFNSAGCLPVWSTISAEPASACAARRMAMSRGRPFSTPPSAIASMNRYANAGLHPLTLVSGSIRFSGSRYDMPTRLNSSTPSALSASEACAPAAMPAMPRRTSIGVFGMTRRTGFCGKNSSRKPSVMPPMMEITSCDGENAPLTAVSIGRAYWGLIANTTISLRSITTRAPLFAPSLTAVKTPYFFPSVSRRSALTSVTETCSGLTRPLARTPLKIASPIWPPPINPILFCSII